MKLVDKILLVYSALLAVALTVMGLRGGLTTQNLIMIALFLPVTGYFIYLLYRAYTLKRHFHQNLEALKHPPTKPHFSILAFFRQKDPFFLITLCLFISLTCALIVKTLTTL